MAVLTVLCTLQSLPGHAEPKQLVDFKLKDQFGTIHQLSDVSGNVVLIIGSDKGGSQYNEVWAVAVHNALNEHPLYDQIKQVPQADLRGVPRLLRPVVRAMFPNGPGQWVLMDWEGAIASEYAFVPGVSNLLVFAQDGSLVLQTSGTALDEEVLDTVIEALRNLIDAKQTH